MYWTGLRIARIVHCRTGSLETERGPMDRLPKVHCRTGSLENKHYQIALHFDVHCRIGSLEKSKNHAK